MVNDPYYRRASLLRVVDGDTLHLRIDLGWNHYSDHSVRLLRVNTPEMRGETKEAGHEAHMFTWDWLDTHRECAEEDHRDQSFIIRSEKDDAFGRYLVEVWCQEGHNLNDALLEAGYPEYKR